MIWGEEAVDSEGKDKKSGERKGQITRKRKETKEYIGNLNMTKRWIRSVGEENKK